MDEPGIVSTRPGPRSDRLSNVRRALVVILILNLLVAAAKFGYGTWSGSVAMRADGLPSFPGGLAPMVALVTVAIAARPLDEHYPAGCDVCGSLNIAALVAFRAVQDAPADW